MTAGEGGAGRPARRERRRERRRRSGPGEWGTGETPPRPEPGALPGWAPHLVFALATLILFRAFIFTDSVLFGTDTLSLGYMARLFFAESLRQGIFPLWNPIILGGTPFLDSLAGGDSLYPPSLLLLLVMDTGRSLGWKLVLHVFLAGVFMYAWCRTLGRSRVAATVAGVGFLTAPFLVSLVYPGHDGKIFVTALTPLVFLAAERTLRGKGWGAATGLGASVALVLLTTHFQMAYFLFGAVGLYAVVRAVQEGRGEMGPRRAGGRLLAFLLASLVGAGAAGVQLLPAVAYITEHSRRTATTLEAESPEAAREYAASWSLHPEEALATLVLPEFVGNDAGGAGWTTRTYWGRNVFKLNHEYIGLGLVLLALFSFSGGALPGIRWTLAVIGALAFAFTLGDHSPVWWLLYHLLPGVQLFRAPSMVIFLTGFAVATLAAFGVDRAAVVARGADAGAWRRAFRLLLAGVGAVAVVGLMAASGALLPLWQGLFGEVEPARWAALEAARPHWVRGGLLAMGVGAAVAGAVWLLRSGRLSPLGMAALLAAVVGADGIRVSDPFIQTLDPRELTMSDPNIRFLVAQKEAWGNEPFRVLSLTGRGQDVRPGQFGLELAAGHHPNDLARYRELIGMVGSGFPEHVWDPRTGAFDPNLVQLLNAAFLIWPDAELGSLEGAEPVSRFGYPDGRPYASVYALPTLPRAHLVADVVVEDRDAVQILRSPAFDPAYQVVLPEPPPIPVDGGEVEGEVVWEERTPNRQRLRVTSDRPALMVVSDNWFPAWTATVDGQAVPVLRANHTFRAVPVPAGESRVEFRYRSRLLGWSLVLSVVCFVVLLAPGVAAVAARWRARGG